MIDENFGLKARLFTRRYYISQHKIAFSEQNQRSSCRGIFEQRSTRPTEVFGENLAAIDFGEMLASSFYCFLENSAFRPDTTAQNTLSTFFFYQNQFCREKKIMLMNLSSIAI